MSDSDFEAIHCQIKMISARVGDKIQHYNEVNNLNTITTATTNTAYLSQAVNYALRKPMNAEHERFAADQAKLLKELKMLVGNSCQAVMQMRPLRCVNSVWNMLVLRERRWAEDSIDCKCTPDSMD